MDYNTIISIELQKLTDFFSEALETNFKPEVRNMKLYEISEEYTELQRIAEENEGEVDEQTFANLLNSKLTFNEKIYNISKFVKNLYADYKAYEEAEKEFKKKKQRTKRMIDWLENYQLENMKRVGIDEVKGDLLTTKIRNNPPSVKIKDETLIPDEFKEEKKEIKINKKAILQCLKNDEQVEGAELQRKQSIMIS